MKIFNRTVAVVIVLMMLISCVVYAEDGNSYDTASGEYYDQQASEEENRDPNLFDEELDDSENTEENEGFEASEDDEEETIEDFVDDKEYLSDSEEFNMLVALGFNIPDSESEVSLSREKAALYLASLLGENNIADSSVTYFNDVTIQNKYLKYINLLRQYGYMSGTGDGLFMPDRGMTPIEFVTVILRIAGYRDYAEAAGGYSIKYADIARRNDLFDGITCKQNDVMTEKDALRILTNALMLPVCDIKSTDGDNFVYEVNNSYVLLERFYDLKRVEGFVCAVPYAAIKPYMPVDENEIKLVLDNSEKTYQVDNFIPEDFLGQDVYAYINEQNKVIWMQSRQEINSISLKYDEIADVAFDRTYLTYENEKGKIVKAKISYDAVYIWNGKQYNEVSTDEFSKPHTRIKLTDVDDDGTYELIDIEHGEPMVADVLTDPLYTFGADIDLKELYGSDSVAYPEDLVEKYESFGYVVGYTVSERSTGKTIELNPNSNEYSLQIIKDGKRITYRDIRTGDLLVICESKDGKKKKVYVTRNSVNDTITHINNTDNVIGTSQNGEFKCSFSLDGINLLGRNVVLYVDKDGYVAKYKFSTEGQPVYGYLMNYGKNGKSVFTDRWQARIYTPDKQIVIFDLAEKFKLNDQKGDGQTLQTHFERTGHQLIKYSLNANGEINKIYISTEPEGYSLNSDKPIFTMNAQYNAVSDSKTTYISSTIGMEYSTYSCKRLVVIVDDDGEIIDDRVFYVSSFNGNRTPNIKVYDAVVGKRASMLVMTAKESELKDYLGLNDTFCVVQDITTDIHGKRIEVLRRVDGKPFVHLYYESDSAKFDDLNVGDVLKLNWYETELDGRYTMRDYQKLFTLKADGNEVLKSTICADYPYDSTTKAVNDGRTTHHKYVYGEIKSLGPDSDGVDIKPNSHFVMLEPEGSTSANDWFSFSYGYVSTWVFRYNSRNETVEVCEPGTLKKGDKVFVATSWCAASIIVIYE